MLTKTVEEEERERKGDERKDEDVGVDEEKKREFEKTDKRKDVSQTEDVEEKRGIRKVTKEDGKKKSFEGVSDGESEPQSSLKRKLSKERQEEENESEVRKRKRKTEKEEGERKKKKSGSWRKMKEELLHSSSLAHHLTSANVRLQTENDRLREHVLSLENLYTLMPPSPSIYSFFVHSSFLCCSFHIRKK